MAIPDSLLRDLDELQKQVTELAAREVSGFYVPWYNSNNVEAFYTAAGATGQRVYTAPTDRALVTLSAGLRFRATGTHDATNYWTFTYARMDTGATLFTVNSIGYNVLFDWIPVTSSLGTIPEAYRGVGINLNKVGTPGTMEFYPVWYAVP